MSDTGSGGSTAPKKATKRSGGSASASKKSTAGSSSTAGRKRAPKAEPTRKASGVRVASEAARQFAELSSKQVEGVTSLRRTEEGWEVELEVLELRRIPATTDVLAVYEVTVDSSLELEGYRRTHRYVRGQTED